MTFKDEDEIHMGKDPNERRNGSTSTTRFGKNHQRSLGELTIDPKILTDAVDNVLFHGDAILFGQTRNQTAWTITLMQGRNRETAYAENSAEWHAILRELTEPGEVYQENRLERA